jgi:DNA helicase HerA-like ATPase
MIENAIFLGKSTKPELLYLPLANRHGLITGATGTGKTVTMQIMAEAFAAHGVPVFAADIKGDFAGVAMAGEARDFLLERARAVDLEDYGFAASPVMFWDLFGEQGHPVRTTVTEMGPLLLSRLMGLTEAQEGALNIAFRIADDEGLAVLDLKDLRALLSGLAERGREIRTDYGNVSTVTIGSIQRRLVVLEEQGAENFFGEPALDIRDFMRTAGDGKAYINILAAERLMNSPQLYATFLLWLLSELFEELPEVGDPEKPRLVFFFDEAHLLFAEAPPGLLQKIEQVVKLVRSKGVGVFFITQNPLDIPDSVLAQLGNRIQHALRAYTPREQKAVKTAADTFRPNPEFDTEQAITELGKGEALVSVLDLKGVPTMVERTLIRPPCGRLGPVTPEERREIIAASPLSGQYDRTVDRESAYELLARRARQRDEEPPGGKEGTTRPRRRDARATPDRPPARASSRETATERFVKNVAGSVGRQVGTIVVRQVGNAIVRGLLGGILRR